MRQDGFLCRLSDGEGDKGGRRVVPIGTDLLFCGTKSRLCVAAELCEDLWMSATPGARACTAGANVIVNLSASNDTVTKAEYRRQITATSLPMYFGVCLCFGRAG